MRPFRFSPRSPVCSSGAVLWVSSLVPLACGEAHQEPSSGGEAGELCGDPGAATSTIFAQAESNYRFESEVELPVQSVAPDTVLSFDWTTLSSNFLDQEVSQSEIEAIHLVMWKLTVPELERALNEDDLPQSRIEGLPLTFVKPTEEVATTTLDQFGFLGDPIDPEAFEDSVMPWFDAVAFPPETHTYTLIASKSETPGSETQMIQAFLLDPGVETKEVRLDDSSMSLDWAVSLTDISPVSVPAQQPNLRLDWSRIETNAMGRAFVASNVSEVLIGAFSLELAEIEEQFLDIETIADEMYRVRVPVGKAVNLSEATDERGEPFPGVDASRTWLVGLICEDCYNPAPWYLSRLAVCPGSSG